MSQSTIDFSIFIRVLTSMFCW